MTNSQPIPNPVPIRSSEITPPLDLRRLWTQQAQAKHPRDFGGWAHHISKNAAQWGADQELEACCALMDDWGLEASDLRAARRPKPPSLKDRALQAWAAVEAGMDDQTAMAVIRRALEALPE